MIKKKVNDNEYEIILYDWLTSDGDYLAGSVKRNPDAVEGSDEIYWLFYPIEKPRPVNAGDLRRLSVFVSGLNVATGND